MKGVGRVLFCLARGRAGGVNWEKCVTFRPRSPILWLLRPTVEAFLIFAQQVFGFCRNANVTDSLGEETGERG